MRATGSIPFAEIEGFINKIGTYPITVERLVHLAEAKREDERVAAFYRSFAPDVEFSDVHALVAASEQVDQLNKEEHPREELHAPEED